MQFFQKFLIHIYSFTKRLGLLENPVVKRFFLYFYFLYKKYLEDPFFGLTKQYPHLFKGGYVLDIGSNIGYTSIVFSEAIAPPFQVFSFEPDQNNFASLNQIIDNYKAKNKIVPVLAAVGAETGTVELWHNQSHHADHRILTPTYSKTKADLDQVSVVKLWSVDQFVEAENIASSIKFIKIDVQGYELPVCLGMQQTLAANPDAAIAIEYAPEAMVDLGFEPQSLLQFFETRNYLIYILNLKGHLAPASFDLIQKKVQERGYVDLICSKKNLMLTT
jgi:FkbM family methyltransferase